MIYGNFFPGWRLEGCSGCGLPVRRKGQRMEGRKIERFGRCLSAASCRTVPKARRAVLESVATCKRGLMAIERLQWMWLASQKGSTTDGKKDGKIWPLFVCCKLQNVKEPKLCLGGWLLCGASVVVDCWRLRRLEKVQGLEAGSLMLASRRKVANLGEAAAIGRGGDWGESWRTRRCGNSARWVFNGGSD